MGNSLDEKKSDEKGIFSFGSEDNSPCGDMSYKTRIIGFLACSIIGTVMSFIVSFVFIFSDFDVAVFAVVYSLSQVLNIAGSCFLSTPSGHLKAMKKKHRIIPSVTYISLIILTLIIAIATQIKGLVLLFLILQMIAYYWYTISFIPFGQKILKSLCSACFDFWLT